MSSPKAPPEKQQQQQQQPLRQQELLELEERLGSVSRIPTATATATKSTAAGSSTGASSSLVHDMKLQQVGLLRQQSAAAAAAAAGETAAAVPCPWSQRWSGTASSSSITKQEVVRQQKQLLRQLEQGGQEGSSSPFAIGMVAAAAQAEMLLLGEANPNSLFRRSNRHGGETVESGEGGVAPDYFQELAQQQPLQVPPPPARTSLLPGAYGVRPGVADAAPRPPFLSSDLTLQPSQRAYVPDDATITTGGEEGAIPSSDTITAMGRLSAASTMTGLSVATPISEDEEANLPRALEVDHDQSPTANANHRNRRRRKPFPENMRKKHLFFLVLAALGLAGLVIICLSAAGVFCRKIQTSNPPVVHNNNTHHVDANTTYLMQFLPNETLAVIDFPSEQHQQQDLQISSSSPTPQTRAFQWLLEDPSLLQYPEGRIRQRFALATFFYATNGTYWNKRDDWLSYDVHECDWYHVERFDFTLQGILYSESPCHHIYYDPSSTRQRQLQYSGNFDVNNIIDNTDPNKDNNYTIDWTYKLLGMRRNNIQGTTIPNEVYWLTDLETTT